MSGVTLERPVDVDITDIYITKGETLTVCLDVGMDVCPHNFSVEFRVLNHGKTEVFYYDLPIVKSLYDGEPIKEGN